MAYDQITLKRTCVRNEETDEVRESGRPGPLAWAQSLTTQRTGSHWSRSRILLGDWLMRVGAGAWPCQPELGSDHLPEPEPLILVTRPNVRDGSIRPSILKYVQYFSRNVLVFFFMPHTQLFI